MPSFIARIYSNENGEGVIATETIEADDASAALQWATDWKVDAVGKGASKALWWDILDANGMVVQGPWPIAQRNWIGPPT